VTDGDSYFRVFSYARTLEKKPEFTVICVICHPALLANSFPAMSLVLLLLGLGLCRENVQASNAGFPDEKRLSLGFLYQTMNCPVYRSANSPVSYPGIGLPVTSR